MMVKAIKGFEEAKKYVNTILFHPGFQNDNK